MPDGRRNNGGPREGSGRKGYGIENAKKHLLKQAFWIVNKKLEKEAKELTEREKIALAKDVVIKELGKAIDITSKGERINNYTDEQIATIAKRTLQNGGDKS